MLFEAINHHHRGLLTDSTRQVFGALKVSVPYLVTVSLREVACSHDVSPCLSRVRRMSQSVRSLNRPLISPFHSSLIGVLKKRVVNHTVFDELPADCTCD